MICGYCESQTGQEPTVSVGWVSAVAKRADAMLWCINTNIMCEICVAALTPFAALLPSQLEHRVQPWRLHFREDTDERCVVRALSETSQGEGTGQKTKWYSNPSRADIRKDFLSGQVMKPGKDMVINHGQATWFHIRMVDSNPQVTQIHKMVHIK